MSDLDQALSAARQAREQAEEAARRAADLEAQAQEAQARAEQEREAKRREWAQRLVDSYDAEVGAADKSIQEAQRRFESVVVSDVASAVKAYIEWGEASMRHYAIQLRIAAAAPLLGMEASPAEFAAPPLFSDALDQALAQYLGTRADAARQEIDAEIAKLDGQGGA